ncbi:MAG: glycine zipper 2TM domain-containing protein [Panacagrimonas sp.]
MSRISNIAAAFLLIFGLAACAPPAEDEGAATAAEELAKAQEELDAAKLAAEEAEAKAKAAEEEAAAAAAKQRSRERAETRAPEPAPPPVCNDCGTVASIEAVKEKGSGSGAGAVLGAIAGGVIGHQFGSGKGNDAATAAGAIAGGYGGHQAEKAIRATTYYRVGVKMDNGSYQTVNVADPAGISVGSAVRVSGGNIQMR